MKKVLVVTDKVSSTEIKAQDGSGRVSVLAGGSSFNVGDTILVVNGVIIQKIKNRSNITYEV